MRLNKVFFENFMKTSDFHHSIYFIYFPEISAVSVLKASKKTISWFMGNKIIRAENSKFFIKINCEQSSSIKWVLTGNKGERKTRSNFLPYSWVYVLWYPYRRTKVPHRRSHSHTTFMRVKKGLQNSRISRMAFEIIYLHLQHLRLSFIYLSLCLKLLKDFIRYFSHTLWILTED